MHQQEKLGKFSDMMSGTTAICSLIVGRTLYVANVGDSRAIIAVRDPDTKKLYVEPPSIDCFQDAHSFITFIRSPRGNSIPAIYISIITEELTT